MATQSQIDAAFKAVRDEWNKAELTIKLAEQVNGEIVNPAIYELRYAGRRIVEAYDLASTDKATILKRLQDAHFDCCRARHDAIDAATSKISAQLENALERLGADILMTHFQQFPDLVERLGLVRDRIAESRGNRESRDHIYAVIAADDLGDIVKIYNRFKASEPLMKQSAKKSRRVVFWSMVLGGLGVLVGVIGALFGLWPLLGH